MGSRRHMVLFRVRSRLCALPAHLAIETMRPLPLESIGAGPAFVRGVSVIRGVPTPVVDPALLLGLTESPESTRFLTVRVGPRQAALAVEAVLGIRNLDDETVQTLPPLLRDAGRDLVAAIGAADSELLLILDSARLVPESMWETLSTTTGTA